MVKGGYFIPTLGTTKQHGGPFMLQHFLDGIQWAVGDIDGPSTSIPQKIKYYPFSKQ